METEKEAVEQPASEAKPEDKPEKRLTVVQKEVRRQMWNKLLKRTQH